MHKNNQRAPASDHKCFLFIFLLKCAASKKRNEHISRKRAHMHRALHMLHHSNFMQSPVLQHVCYITPMYSLLWAAGSQRWGVSSESSPHIMHTSTQPLFVNTLCMCTTCQWCMWHVWDRSWTREASSPEANANASYRDTWKPKASSCESIWYLKIETSGDCCKSKNVGIKMPSSDDHWHQRQHKRPECRLALKSRLALWFKNLQARRKLPWQKPRDAAELSAHRRAPKMSLTHNYRSQQILICIWASIWKSQVTSVAFTRLAQNLTSDLYLEVKVTKIHLSSWSFVFMKLKVAHLAHWGQSGL